MYFSKPTNRFTYVMSSTCYSSNNINNNVPRGIALRPKRICYNDGKFTVRSNEHKNYLIARECKRKWKLTTFFVGILTIQPTMH